MDTAILLAAGFGTKCHPYSATQPKATLPVLNRPNIARLLDDLRQVGIRRFAVVTGHLEAQVRHAVGSAPDVTFVSQGPNPGGTAPAAALGFRALGAAEGLVVYADVTTPGESFAGLLTAARQGSSAALVAALTEGEWAGDHFCATLANERVTGVSGHPRRGSHRLAGAFALTPTAVRSLAFNPGLVTSVPVGGMPPLEGDIAQTLADLVSAGHNVAAVEAIGFAVDIDRPWDILAANRAWLEYLGAGLTESDLDPSAEVSDRADIRGPVVVGPGARVGPGVIIEGPAWIAAGAVLDMGAHLSPFVAVGEGAIVTEYAKVRPHTVIGPRCQIKHTAEVSGVLMENVYAHHHLDFVGVIGRSSDLGAGTTAGTLRFDDRAQSIQVKGRWEAPGPWANCAYIGDFCRTGVGAILMPGVRVGPYSCIGAGVVLEGDLEPRTAISVKQEHTKRPWGPERYGW